MPDNCLFAYLQDDGRYVIELPHGSCGVVSDWAEVDEIADTLDLVAVEQDSYQHE